MPLTDIPDRMPWGEAWRLTEVLAADPSAHVAAALGGWAHPASREWLISAEMLDLFVAANTKAGRHPKPYPRPWDTKPRALGAGTAMTVEEWRAMRKRLGDAERQSRPRDATGRFMKAQPTT